MTRPLLSAIRTGLVLAPLVACGAHPEAPAPVLPPAPAGEPDGANGSAAESGALEGDYALTLRLGTGCAAIPAADRTRTYSAHIAPPARNGNRASSVVTLGTGSFLTGPICTAGPGRYSGVGCNQFFEAESADRALFSLENGTGDAHGGHIVEQLSSGRWIEIIGNASGPRHAAGMEAVGTSQVRYCPLASSDPFRCAQAVGCTADLTLSLARR